MKIRAGFVSNSSSSSYLIVGREVTREELPVIREKAKKLGLFKETLDNTSYDPREYCECEGKDKDCNCQEFKTYFGFGESGDGYGMDSMDLDEFQGFVTKAKLLFKGQDISVFHGRQSNE